MTAIAAVSKPAQSSALAGQDRYKPDLLIYLTLLFTWMSVWRFQDLLPIIGQLKLATVLEVILLVVYFSQTSQIRALKWVKSRTFYGPFILLAIMVVGLPFSLWPGKGFTFIEKDFVPTLLLFTAISTGIRNRDELDWFAFAYLVGAAVYSAYIYVYVPVGADARLGELVFYDANDFGLLVVCAVPFAIYFARPGVKLWKRLVAVSSLILFVQMLMKSGSRGGFIAFIAVLIFILFAFRAIPATLRVGAVITVALILTFLGSAAYWNMMSTIVHPKEDYNMTQPTGRKAIWKRGVRYMLHRPVFGVGASAFPQAEGMLSETSKEFAARGAGLKWSTAHNSFVLVGAELGVGGLFVFIMMISSSFIMLARVRAGPLGSQSINESDVAFARMLMASLVAFCIAGFFVSAAYFSAFYVLIGLVLAQQGVLRRLQVRGVIASGPAREIVRTPRRSQTVLGAHWSPSA